MSTTTKAFEKKDLAYCGLYCPQCSFKTANEVGDRCHLSGMPADYARMCERPLEELACGGCKTDDDNDCAMKQCAQGKAYDSCADCDDFPCANLQEFGADGAPHHAQALRNLTDIRERGVEAWFADTAKELACACGKRQSWYHRCGCEHAL